MDIVPFSTFFFDMMQQMQNEGGSFDYTKEGIDKFGDLMKQDMVKYEGLLQSVNGQNKNEILDMRKKFYQEYLYKNKNMLQLVLPENLHNLISLKMWHLVS
ncbi:MAG: hypothetical protein IPN86_13965 [Saprospiraceae bacterium]|nr:hypothetical protein [Saprospiraceae bacterium]